MGQASSHFTFYTFFGLTIHFLQGKNDINIDKNRYKCLGLFFTLFINCNAID